MKLRNTSGIITTLISATIMTTFIALLFTLILSCGGGVDVGGVGVYTLTIITDGNGTTNPSGSIKVNHGDSTNIQALAKKDFGYTVSFANWEKESGEGVNINNSLSASTTVTLTGGDATIKAIFNKNNLSFSSTDIAVSGNYAYLADGSSGLWIIDISNPSSLSNFWQWDPVVHGFSTGVAVNGNYA